MSSEKKYFFYKYPKLMLLISTFIIAYILFYNRTYQPFNEFIISLGYIGIFMAGMMFAYGFTAAPAIAIFLILSKELNILLAGLIGGIGALIADLFIFQFIRSSFSDELERLSKEKIVQLVNNYAPSIFKKYFITVFAGFIIASPLPDEIGIALLASVKTISTKIFSILSFLLNTAGIFIILGIGNII